MIADFDVDVNRIAAQSFMLTATVNERTRAHILDYLWGTDEQPTVVDVVRRERLGVLRHQRGSRRVGSM